MPSKYYSANGYGQKMSQSQFKRLGNTVQIIIARKMAHNQFIRPGNTTAQKEYGQKMSQNQFI